MPGSASQIGALNVWDSRAIPHENAFSVYRETVCNVFMPWTPEVIARETFYAHISSRTFPDAAVAKLKLGPLIASRTKSDIANSAIDCVYAQYIVSGFMKVVLPQCETILAAGDLMLHDGATPVRLQSNGVEYEVITCMIPKHQLACDDWLPSAILRQQEVPTQYRESQ